MNTQTEYRIARLQDGALMAEFELEARRTEPGVLYGEIVKEEYIEQFEKWFQSQLYVNTRIVLAIVDGRVAGRCDFTMKGSFMDGFRNAYVDWIYVLKPYRHQGVAQGLIAFMEQYLWEQDIEEYFLITAHNDEAQSFYTHFEGYERSEDWVLRKSVKSNTP